MTITNKLHTLLALNASALSGCDTQHTQTVGTVAKDIKAQYYVNDTCAVGAAKVLLRVQDNIQIEIERQCVESTVNRILSK